MKYSLTAVALASLATGSLAGVVHGHHRHHAREAEPEPTNYTYSDGQCWGTYGCEPTKAVKAANAAVQTNVPAAPTGGAQAPAAGYNQAPSSTSSSSASAPSGGSTGGSSNSNSNSNGQGNAGPLGDATSVLSKLGVSVGSDASCQHGSGLPNQMEVHNEAGEDFIWACAANGDKQFVNTHPVAIAVPVSSGSSETFSFADTAQYAQGPICVPVFSNTPLSQAGQFNNTMLEATFNSYGTVDVSREIQMYGHSISATTPSSCTTSMDQCVYKCKDQAGAPNASPPQFGACGGDGTYELTACPTTITGANPAPSDGGCFFGTPGQSSGGKMTVTVGKPTTSY